METMQFYQFVFSSYCELIERLLWCCFVFFFVFVLFCFLFVVVVFFLFTYPYHCHYSSFPHYFYFTFLPLESMKTLNYRQEKKQLHNILIRGGSRYGSIQPCPSPFRQLNHTNSAYFGAISPNFPPMLTLGSLFLQILDPAMLIPYPHFFSHKNCSHNSFSQLRPLHFQTGGMAPPLFWPSCSKVKKKNTLINMLLNVLHDEKECNKSLHLSPHFQKSSNFWGVMCPFRSWSFVLGARSSIWIFAWQPASTTAGADAPFSTSKNLGPPTSKIVPPPMVGLVACWPCYWNIRVSVKFKTENEHKIIVMSSHKTGNKWYFE